jgi:flagellar hook protein FlgE
VGEIGSQTISSTVYDALGEAHTFILTLTQTDYNTWSYSSRFLNGEVIFAGGEGNISFDTDGNITNITDTDGNRVDEITVSFDPGNGSGNIRFDLDINGSTDFGAVTQFDGTTSIGVISQDGFAKGELLDVFIDSAGNIVGSYSNGKTKNLAQVALATVANQQALNHVGDGLFAANVQSGQLLIQTANNIDGTTVNSGFLEGSNVDLAEQFTDMIITQRAYQSNARVITTADQLLAEAVQLKR